MRRGSPQPRGSAQGSPVPGPRQPPGHQGTLRAAGSPQLPPRGPPAVASPRPCRRERCPGGSCLPVGIAEHLCWRVPGAAGVLARKRALFLPSPASQLPKDKLSSLGVRIINA